jgi:hypothetical protein
MNIAVNGRIAVATQRELLTTGNRKSIAVRFEITGDIWEGKTLSGVFKNGDFYAYALVENGAAYIPAAILANPGALRCGLQAVGADGTVVCSALAYCGQIEQGADMSALKDGVGCV